MFGGTAKKRSKKNSDSVSTPRSPISNTQIVHASWLQKRGRFNTALQPRYCVASSDRSFAYYKNEGDAKPAGKPIALGTVHTINLYLDDEKTDLDDEKIAELGSGHSKRDRSYSVNVLASSVAKQKQFMVELVTDDRAWALICPDLASLQRWREVLGTLCFGRKLHSGYLRKTGPNRKAWHQRFVVMYDVLELRYFESNDLSKQKGVVHLDEVRRISAPKPTQYHFAHCFELETPTRTWLFAAESARERDVWMDGIKSCMRARRVQFVPTHSAFLSLFDATSQRFRKMFVAVDAASQSLCCFGNQIECKQLESAAVYGRQQYEALCNEKMKKVISLSQLKSAVTIERGEFLIVHSNCKQDMAHLQFLFTLKLPDEQLYFAVHPNRAQTAAKWVNAIENVGNAQRREVHAELVRRGYKATHIAAALEHWEVMSGSSTDYDVEELCAMIRRIVKAKPDVKTHSMHTSTRSKSSKHSRSKSAKSELRRLSERSDIASIQPSTPQFELKLRRLSEHEDSNNTSSKPRRLSVSAMSLQDLDEANCMAWTPKEVALWMRKVEGGLIVKVYPQLLDALLKLKVDGVKLKALNDMNLEQMGVTDALHRALVMEALENLELGV